MQIHGYADFYAAALADSLPNPTAPALPRPRQQGYRRNASAGAFPGSTSPSPSLGSAKASNAANQSGTVGAQVIKECRKAEPLAGNHWTKRPDNGDTSGDG